MQQNSGTIVHLRIQSQCYLHCLSSCPCQFVRDSVRNNRRSWRHEPRLMDTYSADLEFINVKTRRNPPSGTPHHLPHRSGWYHLFLARSSIYIVFGLIHGQLGRDFAVLVPVTRALLLKNTNATRQWGAGGLETRCFSLLPSLRSSKSTAAAFRQHVHIHISQEWQKSEICSCVSRFVTVMTGEPVWNRTNEYRNAFPRLTHCSWWWTAHRRQHAWVKHAHPIRRSDITCWMRRSNRRIFRIPPVSWKWRTLTQAVDKLASVECPLISYLIEFDWVLDVSTPKTMQ